MFLKGLEINQALGRKENMAGIYGNLGIYYVNTAQLPRAKEMLLKSLQLFEEMGNPNTRRVQQLLDGLQTTSTTD
jgi:hypothetical protein